MKTICIEVLKENGLEDMFYPIYNITTAGLIQIRINKKYTSDDMDINQSIKVFTLFHLRSKK